MRSNREHDYIGNVLEAICDYYTILFNILLVSAWQDLRCRNEYRQPWVLTRQAALPGFHTLIGADINGHGTQGKLKPTYFKMFLKASDEVINIRNKEGQSEEESHLADEFRI